MKLLCSHAMRRALLTATVAGSALLLAGCQRAEEPKLSFTSVDITGADMAPDSFTMNDQEGRARSLADYRGKLVVVFFGFTQCPDVCPTTLGELAAVKQALGKDGDRLQPVFISVDPERDTPTVLKAYMAAFDPSFVALRGTDEQTKAAAKAFKAMYAKAPGKEPGSYTMDHTAASYVLDAQGRPRLYVRYGTPVANWVSDLKQLL